MEEKNELNDIILNKNNSAAGNKKIILAVATLGVVLIIVVMLMNTLTSKGTDNLPQAILPPEPEKIQPKITTDEPLFQEVEVVKEDKQNNDSLDMIAQKLKEESQKEEAQPVVTQNTEKAENVAKKESVKESPKEAKKATPQAPEPKSTLSYGYYIQVGSFSRNAPNKRFLDSITKLGYKYKFHEVTSNSKSLNKVLVGPFNSDSEARKALKPIKSSIEPGAFIIKL